MQARTFIVTPSTRAPVERGGSKKSEVYGYISNDLQIHMHMHVNIQSKAIDDKWPDLRGR